MNFLKRYVRFHGSKGKRKQPGWENKVAPGILESGTDVSFWDTALEGSWLQFRFHKALD